MSLFAHKVVIRTTDFNSERETYIQVFNWSSYELYYFEDIV